MYLDFIAPNVLLAQAVGRMGNFVNQELYGPATNLAWAFHINPTFPCQLPDNLPAGIQYCGTADPLTQETIAWYATHGFHPTFFYEAIWNLAAFAILTFVFKRYGERFRRGDGIWLYFIAYPLGRFWVGTIFEPRTPPRAALYRWAAGRLDRIAGEHPLSWVKIFFAAVAVIKSTNVIVETVRGDS